LCRKSSQFEIAEFLKFAGKFSVTSPVSGNRYQFQGAKNPENREIFENQGPEIGNREPVTEFLAGNSPKLASGKPGSTTNYLVSDRKHYLCQL
jgi:hypothetical protein